MKAVKKRRGVAANS